MGNGGDSGGGKPSAAATTAALLGAFAAGHVFYYLLGIRFDSTPLWWYWQYLDPELLEHKLLQSVFYLHSQPPLFNLFLGAVLKLSGGASRYVFQAVYLAAGLTLYLALFRLQVKLGVSRRPAFATSTAFVLLPSFVLYEHWLFYAFPLAALLTLSALWFYEVVARPRARAMAAFGACVFLICGLRHTFHVAYYVVVAAAAAGFGVGARRKRLLVAAAPFLILVSVYVKNYVLFGEFAASSWTGMNLWQMTGVNLTLEEREALLAEGKPSAAALAMPFSAVADYPPAYADVSGFAAVDALARPYKSTGPTNYNHLAYVGISRAYLADSLYVMRRFPLAYGKGLLRSWSIYFRPSSDYVSGVEFLDEGGNLGRVAFANDLLDRGLFGKVTFEPVAEAVSGLFLLESVEPFYVYLWICLPLVLCFGFKAALGRRAFGEGTAARARRLTVLYICFNILYVAVVVNSCSWAETNRMRFPTDPLYVVLLGLFVQEYIAGGLRRRP